MALRLTFLLPLAALLASGCRATAPAAGIPVADDMVLLPVDSAGLDGPVAAVCRDGGALLMLEASGTRLLRRQFDTTRVETIPLTRRVTAPRGVHADRFYFYVYDEAVLYRMSKQDLELRAWLNNVRVTGLASYAPGEALVADAERNRVWLKTLFGESREFLDAVTVTRPGPIGTTSEGVFCLLAAGRRLLWFNRAGIVTRTVVLDRDGDYLAVDDAGRVFVLGRASHDLLVVTGRGYERLRLGGLSDPVGAVAGPDRLFVLDGGSRIVSFQLP